MNDINSDHVAQEDIDAVMGALKAGLVEQWMLLPDRVLVTLAASTVKALDRSRAQRKK